MWKSGENCVTLNNMDTAAETAAAVARRLNAALGIPARGRAGRAARRAAPALVFEERCLRMVLHES